MDVIGGFFPPNPSKEIGPYSTHMIVIGYPVIEVGVLSRVEG